MSRTLQTWMRLLTLAVALACQISAGAAVPMQDAAEAQARLVASVAVFCQSGAQHKHDGAPSHRQVPDHVLCRVLSAHAHGVAVLDGSAPLPLPGLARMDRFGLPGARAPPPRVIYASLPRGPPSVV